MHGPNKHQERNKTGQIEKSESDNNKMRAATILNFWWWETTLVRRSNELFTNLQTEK